MLPFQRKTQYLVLSTVAFVPNVPSGCTDGQMEICLWNSLYSSTFENIKHLSLVSQEEIKAAVAVPKLGRRLWFCTHIP